MTILQEILEHKRGEVAQAKERVPPSSLMAQAARAEPRRGFARVLKESANRPALIAEVKRASPSMGEIRGDLNPIEVARAYERAGAECLSVLTDAKYFGGSEADLRAVREAVGLPILRKDFVFDEYQLDEALVWGADAVLLIVAMLSFEELTYLYRAARERGLDVLVEVHTIEEASLAHTLHPELVGINNRDLGTFETDLDTTRSVADTLRKDVFVVSESAIRDEDDVRRVAGFGAGAVLVGTAFCSEPDIEAAVRRIMAR